MMFPEDWHDFLKDYSFDDSEEVYTNGSRLIPVFRVEQLIEHLLKAQEPRLLTFEDFDNNPEVDSKGRLPAWVEHNWKNGPALTDDGYAAITKQEMENWDRSFIRWWTSRPSKEQMEAIPWDG